ncbi:restriction endonuclease subunit S [Geminocystis sp. NIES-3708]|uniref:restriction endonuclease subunit S n=1 Tax=Geminocystis sp. NIES-3708 TaxID=1615909 RepID=UPI0009EC621F|nr:restriction endonuclease subunit S [Geminocystis sp. NIES-3708]
MEPLILKGLYGYFIKTEVFIVKYFTNNPNGINWIKISDASASSKYIYQTKEKIKPEGIRNSRLVNEGDFILSNSMSFGRPYIMKTSGCIHYGWLVLKDKSGLFDQDYLYYFLGSNTTYKQFDNLAAGSTVRNLNTTPIQKVEIVIPPLEVQKRIVEILDEAFEGIDRAIALSKQNLLNAHELFDSYLNNIFTNKGDDWVEKKLGDICQNLDSKRIPITKSQRKKGNIPYYGASGIVDYVEGYIFDENLLLISDENLLLISEDGANLLARTYPIAFSISGKTWVNNHAHVLKFKSINLQKFIEYYFNSISLKPYVTGMAQPKLNQTTLNSIIVPFPSEKYCQNIVNKLDKLSTEVKRLEEIYQKKVALVNEGMIERGKK